MTGADAPRAGRREWIGLAVIALPCVLYSMDLTVLYLAVPHRSRRISDLEHGALVDHGHLRVLPGGVPHHDGHARRSGRPSPTSPDRAAAFGIASVLAAFSTTVAMLIVSRALLGVAAHDSRTFDALPHPQHVPGPGQRTLAIGVWTTSFAAGAAIGPLLGGILLEFFWWGSVFLLAVPVMAMLLVVGPRLLPEYRDPPPGDWICSARPVGHRRSVDRLRPQTDRRGAVSARRRRRSSPASRSARCSCVASGP